VGELLHRVLLISAGFGSGGNGPADPCPSEIPELACTRRRA
jgi:hypothetical protein